MKALVWKEFRLQLPALLMGLGFIPAGLLILWMFNFKWMAASFALALAGISLMTGAASVSGEAERKTLVFLLEKPVKLKKIWLSKFISGMAVIIIIYSIYAPIVLIPYARGSVTVTPAWHSLIFTQSVTYYIFMPFAIFALSLFISVFINKSLNAAIVTIIAGTIAGFLFFPSAQLFDKYSLVILPFEVGLLTGTLFFFSCKVFCKKFSCIRRREKIWSCILAPSAVLVILLCLSFINYGAYFLVKRL